jgi:sugar/nucleoside kinase (ribokinase family)
LGIRAAFVGAVGRDSFGRFVTQELRRHGVDTRGVVLTSEGKTRLAFVAVTRTGERDFEFWERRPADQFLRTRDVDIARVTRSTIVHIGAFLLVAEPSRQTAFSVARKTIRNGGWISFDPNLRLSLWGSDAEARRVCRMMMRWTSILRLNSDESRFLTGARSLAAAARQLLDLGPRIVVITEGKEGCAVGVDQEVRHVRGFRVRAIDTTGCGDGFLAGLLAGIVRNPISIERMGIHELEVICRTANAVGALVALTPGAIPAMPSLRQLQSFLREYS